MSLKAKAGNVNDNSSPGPDGGSDDCAAIAIDRFLGLSSEDVKPAPMVTGAGTGTDIDSQHDSELSYLDVIRSKYRGAHGRVRVEVCACAKYGRPWHRRRLGKESESGL